MKNFKGTKEVSKLAIGLLALGSIASSAVFAEDQKWNFYGHINRQLAWANDKHESHALFADSDASRSRFGFTGHTMLEQGWSVGGKLEAGLSPANSADISQLQRDTGGVSPTARHADVWLGHDKFGKISLGLGSHATDAYSQYTLSGTDLASYIGVADPVAGMYFHLKGSPARVTTANARVTGNFDPFDQFGRKPRLRYDTPSFAGFTLSGSVGSSSPTTTTSNDDSALALTYNNTLGDVKVNGALGLEKRSKAAQQRNFGSQGVSLALLHEPTGFNVAGAYGKIKRTGSITDITKVHAKVWYVQLGKQWDCFTLGKTSFAVDYHHGKNRSANSDHAKSYGAGLVQDMEKVNSSAYFGVRKYKYTGANETTKAQVLYDPITAAFVGMQVRF